MARLRASSGSGGSRIDRNRSHPAFSRLWSHTPLCSRGDLPFSTLHSAADDRFLALMLERSSHRTNRAPRYSARSVPLNDSTCALSVGLPGRVALPRSHRFVAARHPPSLGLSRTCNTFPTKSSVNLHAGRIRVDDRDGGNVVRERTFWSSFFVKLKYQSAILGENSCFV